MPFPPPSSPRAGTPLCFLLSERQPVWHSQHVFTSRPLLFGNTVVFACRKRVLFQDIVIQDIACLRACYQIHEGLITPDRPPFRRCIKWYDHEDHCLDV